MLSKINSTSGHSILTFYKISFFLILFLNNLTFTNADMYEYFNSNINNNNNNNIEDLGPDVSNYSFSKQESHFQVIFSDDDPSTPLNSSDNFDLIEMDNPYKVYSLPAKITLSILASTASLITVSGNLLVMLSFFLDRQIRNPTNYFILSLSVSDFVIGFVSMPFLTLYLMIGKWPFGQIICNLWLSLDYTVCLTSIYTVLFITIDRFCSVKIPAKYRKWRSPNKIIIMVMLTWLVPCGLFFTSIFAWSYGSNIEFDPRNCDVAWSSNKIFSVTLVFSYFWTTLVVIIVLYIFIYQVARNLEKKSREKQRKLSSLVGCSASNTGALVGVVVIPSSTCTKKNGLISPDDEEEELTDSQSKLNKPLSKKKRLQFIKSYHKNPSINRKDIKINKVDTFTPSSNTTSTNENEEKNKNHDSKKSNNTTTTGVKKSLKNTLATNYSYASTISKDEDFSSSYDSHSDFDNNNNKKKSVIEINREFKSPQLISLKPRPESLAVMTQDQFDEKCNNTKQSSDKKSPNKETNKPGIPFIDDEYDDLTYVLTRRQFAGKENKVPIKEEKIFIKSRSSILQKISTPIRNSFSRRSSQKSQTNETINSPSKFDLLSSQFSEEKSKLLNEKKNEQKELEVLENGSKMSNSLAVSTQTSSKITPSSTQTIFSSTFDSCSTQIGCKSPLEKTTSLTNREQATSRSVGTVTSGLITVGNGGVRPMPKRKTKHENRARKALRTITFILGAFMCCFAPWHVVSIYNSFCPNCFDSNLYHHFFYSCYFLCYLNSPINPFMYALANQQFKKTFFRILKGDWRRL
ncbi:unnamed protein product [Brachionus calyciflorus]|uniref:G-protein coupled receptors family 1 profile domain-containing protein n=1 Tax=Brachionus calyciflorus TaxID=104777 RepID=A0A813MA87_9BILA|nr:unnamed protein product [Brachionus calyciflorus]